MKLSYRGQTYCTGEMDIITINSIHPGKYRGVDTCFSVVRSLFIPTSINPLSPREEEYASIW